MQVSFRQTFQQHLGFYVAGTVLLLATNALGAWIPLQVKGLLDSFTLSPHQATGILLGSLALCALSMYVARVGSRYFLLQLGRLEEHRLRTGLFSHLLAMPQSFYDVYPTGELMSRVSNDLSTYRMFVGGAVMLLINVVAAYAMVLPAMASLSLKVTLIVFCLYPLALGIMQKLSARVRGLTHTVQETLGVLTSQAQESLAGIRVIQAYAKDAEECQRFTTTCDQYYHANTALTKTRAWLYILIAALGGSGILLTLTFGGMEAMARTLSPSSLVAFTLYMERLAWPTISIGWVLSSWQQARVAKDRFNTLLSLSSHLTDQAADPSIQALPEGPLEIRNLSFAYQNPYQTDAAAPAPLVLRNLTLSLEPGQLVALVGAVGCGKSTLLKLLARLYPAPAGTLQLGGLPVETIPLAVYRHGVGMMPQQAFLFSQSIQENLQRATLRPEVSVSTLEPAMVAAHMHHEVLEMPQGYQTPVGERGITLSGGQRQRMTLARTLVQNPHILLLDDPVASVDRDTEHAIVQALQARKLTHNALTLVATQRLSLAQIADQVVFLAPDGSLEAMGTHAQLLKDSPAYQALFQQKDADDTDEVA